MKFPVSVRGFNPRPWKTGKSEQRYSGTFVVLDLSPEGSVLKTMNLVKDFPTEEEMKRAAHFVGKQAVAVISDIRNGMDGQAQLVGELELAEKPKG